MNTTTRPAASAPTSAGFHAATLESDSRMSAAAGPSIHELAWSPYTKEDAPVVLLLLDHRSASRATIQRAVRFADGLRGSLHVALTIPNRSARSRPMVVVSYVMDLLRSLRPRLGFDLEIVRDPITERAIAIARDLSPAVIVVDSALGAAEARRLVDKLDRPVLIARDARPNGELLAASDMSDAQFPVLARARSYARALERDITFFHNAKPMSVFVADPMSGGTSYASMLQMQEDVAAAKSAQLRNLAKTGRHAAAFVARAANTIDALLDLATERDADVIVVGHRPRSGIRRLLGRSTAERVIGRSGRSVLVVPVDRAV
jgi:nucleotide-binding universal stress UspA family protein